NQLNIENNDPKKTIYLTTSQGDVVKGCPGTDDSYLYCRYQVINHTLNCPLNCTYCILQYYLNQPATVIYTDFEKIFNELDKKLRKQPNRFFRVGTGELGDSIALPGSRLFAKELIKKFLGRKNLLLEFKTKVDDIDSFLAIDREGPVVLAWSVNPQEIAASEESMASGLIERLKAAKKAQEAGYLLAFHFDPILEWEKWHVLYPQVVKQIYSYVDPNRITWISLGSLRFPPETKSKIAAKYPQSNIIYSEMIKGHDNKMRYVRPLRVPIYQKVYQQLNAIENPPFIYFCMENKTVWNDVMGFAPKSNAHLDFIFAKSLYERFDDVVLREPRIEHYLNAPNLDGKKF
ncbi:MAG: hypothetical protein K9M80_09760, partial [Candidatus Marinimicrobia bacterium]|nr:hypothetical protein [Candidatus Neomarinimicrobiota bacterium]